MLFSDTLSAYYASRNQANSWAQILHAGHELPLRLRSDRFHLCSGLLLFRRRLEVCANPESVPQDCAALGR